MGMMDGGLNFQDTCHKCECSKHGGSMRRYIQDRNIKISKLLSDVARNNGKFLDLDSGGLIAT